jgi:hypothetical protein
MPQKDSDDKESVMRPNNDDSLMLSSTACGGGGSKGKKCRGKECQWKCQRLIMQQEENNGKFSQLKNFNTYSKFIFRESPS